MESIDKAYFNKGLGTLAINFIYKYTEARKNILKLSQKVGNLPSDYLKSLDYKYGLGWNH